MNTINTKTNDNEREEFLGDTMTFAWFNIARISSSLERPTPEERLSTAIPNLQDLASTLKADPAAVPAVEEETAPHLDLVLALVREDVQRLGPAPQLSKDAAECVDDVVSLLSSTRPVLS